MQESEAYDEVATTSIDTTITATRIGPLQLNATKTTLRKNYFGKLEVKRGEKWPKIKGPRCFGGCGLAQCFRRVRSLRTVRPV